MRLAALIAFLPALAHAQAPPAAPPPYVTIAAGLSIASTERSGTALQLGYHRPLHSNLGVATSLSYHTLSRYSGPSYAPCQPGTVCAVPPSPGKGLVGAGLEIELNADRTRVGPYLIFGAGAFFFLHPPEPGTAFAPAGTAAVGFDVPVSVSRLRIELRYQQLVGVDQAAVALGTATVAFAIPVVPN